MQQTLPSDVMMQSELPLPKHQGKVRDIYDLGDRLLLVATDRVSAFDVVLPTGVPESSRRCRRSGSSEPRAWCQTTSCA